MNADELLIYSDMDGTLVASGSRGPAVPKNNLASIREFLQRGGHFSVATGRQYTDTLPLFPDITFNAPSVQGNGTLLYDCGAKEILEVTPLPSSYKEESLRYFLRKPGFGFTAADAFDIYQVDTGDPVRDGDLPGRTRAHISIGEYMAKDIVKVVYISEDLSALETVIRDTASFQSAGLVNAVLSEPRYYEVFSRLADKAFGIRRAVELASLQRKTLICIGDYLNDETMLRTADIAACPANAPRYIKDICQIVTCDCTSGAVADLIYRLCGF